MIRRPPRSTLFPSTTLSRSVGTAVAIALGLIVAGVPTANADATGPPTATVTGWIAHHATPLTTVNPQAALDDLAPLGRRSEEHTSELQSQSNLVCRLLLEKK